MRPVTSDIENRATIPAPPATASRCPRLAFSDVQSTEVYDPEHKAPTAALTSIGSPSAVPVPCASRVNEACTAF